MRAEEIDTPPPDLTSPLCFHKLVIVCSWATNAEAIALHSDSESPDMLSKEKQVLFFADKWFNQS